MRHGLALLALLCAVAFATVESRSKRSRTDKAERSLRNAEGVCAQPWQAPNPAHLFPRCDFDELTPEEMTPTLFAEKYSLQRPFILRNATDNDAARRFLADRCDIVERFGDVRVNLGDPFSLARDGTTSSSVSLRKYLDTPFDLSKPRYFFDRHGRWVTHLGELASMLETPADLQLQPADAKAPIIFAIGKTGSGIGLHAHQDAWNQVLFGAKRWTLYPSSGVPPEAGYNPTEPHLQWLSEFYPLVKEGANKPLECVQQAGDVVYVPEGWYHATVNLGDTGAIARRPEDFTRGSPREIGKRAANNIMRKNHDTAISLAEEAQRLSPVEGDHAINLGYALDSAGRLEEASAAFQRAVELQPRNPGAYMTLGKLLNDRGDHRKAHTALTAGTELIGEAGGDNALAKALLGELARARNALLKL